MNLQKSTYFPLLALLSSLALVLLAIVDFRRGFLFAKAAYIAKNPYFVFSPFQLVLVMVGVAGVFYFGRRLREPHARSANAMLIGVFILLLIDAGLYRGVAAARALDAGKIGTDWLGAFGVVGSLKPFALSASYVLTVWHATVLSCLGAGLALVALPRILKGAVGQPGWRGTMAGTVYAFTQPFCSCCAAITAPSLFRSQRAANFGLAVLLGAPLLNISTLILAGSLLPWPYVILRLFGGLAVTVILSYVLSRWVVIESSFEDREQKNASRLNSDVPSALLTNWLKLSGRIALILVPAMVVGTLLSSVIWNLWPTELGNSIAAVVLTSIFGSLVMVSTWTEIPLASAMIQQGMTGPAASALLALPAVNLGSLLIIRQVTNSWRVALGLACCVIAISIGVGALFL